MRNIVLYSSLILCLLMGCTHSIYVRKPTEESIKGAEYFLPKKVLDLKITYTVKQQFEIADGYVSKTGEPEYSINKPIAVTETVIRDNGNCFSLCGEDLSDNIFLEGGIEVTLDDNGILQSVNSEVHDKTMDFVNNTFTFAFNVAKLAAVAGEETVVIDAVGTQYQNLVKNIQKKLVEELSNGELNAKAKLEAIENYRKILANLYDIIKLYQEKNNTYYEEKDYEYTARIDPGAQEILGKKSIRILPPDYAIPGAKGNQLPGLVVELELGEDEINNAKYQYFNNEKTSVEGIVYRQPACINTKIKVQGPGGKNYEVYNRAIEYPQFGRFRVVNVESKGPGNNKNSLTFNTNTGSIKTYKVNGGSTADETITALNSTIEDMKNNIVNVKYDSEIENLKKQTEILKAKIDLETQKAALEKLQKNAE